MVARGLIATAVAALAGFATAAPAGNEADLVKRANIDNTILQFAFAHLPPKRPYRALWQKPLLPS